MKLNIDFENKTIKLEADVKLAELVFKLEHMFPKDEWKEFTLKVKDINYIAYYPMPPINPYVLWGGTDGSGNELDRPFTTIC